MFNIFKKKNPIDKLEDKHQKLLEEAFKLSKINRSESDRKMAEAEVIMNQILDLQSKNHSA